MEASLAAPERKTVLILGGTAEATTLARTLSERPGLRVITSLAGRTKVPRHPPGEVRVGGFSGVDGLARFVEDNRVAVVVDATHPFATRISANALDASDRTGVPLLAIARPAWTRQAGDLWTEVRDEQEAAAALPAGARALLALGSQRLGAFAGRGDVTFFVRMIDAPKDGPPLAGCTVIVGRPSREARVEETLLREHRISHLVCRNSGGDASYAKIVAARALALPVIIIGQPRPAGGAMVSAPEEAVARLEAILA